MPRAGTKMTRGRWARIAAVVLGVLPVTAPLPAQKPKAATPAAAPVTTLERVRAAGRIRLGYRPDARPFSFTTSAGDPDGYTVGLCLNVANALKADLGLPALVVEWVPVTVDNRFALVQQGRVDLLCGAETRTLARMQEVAFSTATFPGGIGALVRTDAPTRLKETLNGRQPATRPTWRASAVSVLQAQTFAVLAGTTTEDWVARKKQEFQLVSTVVPVTSYEAGVRQVLDRKVNVFFGDRAILLDAARNDPSAAKLEVLDRMFTSEPMALAFARNNDDLRVAVDRALSRLYAAGEFTDLYAMWFGAPDASTLAYFKWNAVPE